MPLPTSLTLVAEAPGFAPSEMRERRVDRSGVVEVEIRLRPGRWIDFTVVDTAGSPIPNAKVEVDSGRSERTDSQGRARLGLGAWSFCHQVGGVVSASGHRSSSVSIPSIHDPDPPSSVRVVLPKTGFVYGRVDLPDGRPACDGPVFVEHLDPHGPDLHGIISECAQSDGDGRFRVDSCGGRLRIEAHFATWERSFRGTWEGEPGEREITVVLAPVARQDGPPEPRHTIRVLDSEGQPVASGRCEAGISNGDALGPRRLGATES